VSPAVGTTPVFQLAPGEPVGRCGSGPVCLRVGKQTRSFQRAGAQAAPLTVGRRQCGLHQLQLHATERYGHPQFPRWDIRYSDIHFLQKCRAHYAVCTIPWQASFDWHAGNRTPNAHVGGSEGHRRRLSDLDYGEAIDALIASEIDVAMVPTQLDDRVLQRALGAPGVQLMNVAQAEAIAKTVAGLKHVVLWRGVVSLTGDVPNSDTDLLALRNRLLVRKDLHPALQYLLLEAMREVHGAPGPFNRLGEFPAEQPNDLPLSATAEAFYRSGATFWQRYTSFWLTSLLNRVVFFVIPVVAALIPIIGFAPRFYRWLYVRRIDRLHRALGNLER
jgi:hypothetical protein